MKREVDICITGLVNTYILVLGFGDWFNEFEIHFSESKKTLFQVLVFFFQDDECFVVLEWLESHPISVTILNKVCSRSKFSHLQRFILYVVTVLIDLRSIGENR